APCLPGSFACDGAVLQQCSAAGTAWERVEQCASPDLCKAASGMCTDSECLPGDTTCMGDTLLTCGSDFAFSSMRPCEAGLCDGVAGQCDVCVPGTKDCNAPGTGTRTCKRDGQGYQESICPGGTPHCIDGGTCVECRTAADCDSDNPCETPVCSAGRCGTTHNREDCRMPGGGNGTCSSGTCVECVTSLDCGLLAGHPGRPYCVRSECQPCPSPPCTVGTSCDSSQDCQSTTCKASTCRPRCSGNCAGGERCAANDDCASDQCTNGTCEAEARCGDGILQTERGEQCDPGRNVSGCTNCRITERYERCTPPASGVDVNASGLCASLDNGAVPFMRVPVCSSGETCTSIPGAPWTIRCINSGCLIQCSATSDCPPDFTCWNRQLCWKL
ncbi:MAG: hypothetical protein OXU20_13195, partial [Myxococcales bacterium]|nr:hypothetical protein [Myxococcales bacterium]